ncbi:MAG: hypothetical protein IT270_14560 [Saprospiraceae bacterium]|nr:hypothetical protein [Saprospiraceae bacterium]
MEKINEFSADFLINTIIKELNNNAEIQSVITTDIKKIGNYDIINLQRLGNLVFIPDIISIYELVNGFRASWNYKGRIGGEINMLDIASVGLGYDDEFWKKDWKKYKTKDDKVFRQFWEKLSSLDIFENSSDSVIRVVAELESKHPEPQSPPLWLWHLAGEKYPLTLDIPQYWQMLGKTRGFIGWPYFFIDLEKCRFDDPFFKKYFSSSVFEAIPYMEDFLKTMPILFPDDDFSEFEVLFRKLKSTLEE